MDYLLIEDGVIANIIVCDSDEDAAAFGALPFYEGAAIGETYAPPPPDPAPPTLEERVTKVETTKAEQADVDAITAAIERGYPCEEVPLSIKKPPQWDGGN